jgi:menaquinone-dependent protoporphyrinogen IX oxidase
MDHPTDSSQDSDYTDWGAVDRWAHELTATLAPMERTQS